MSGAAGGSPKTLEDDAIIFPTDKNEIIILDPHRDPFGWAAVSDPYVNRRPGG